MAQHPRRPATEAMEKSKKRRRTEDFPSEIEARSETKVDFDMTAIFRQANLADPEACSFPLIDWSFDDEDCVLPEQPPEVRSLSPPRLGITILDKQGNPKNALITNTRILDRNLEDEVVESCSLKKRKFVTPDVSPQMVRTIALSSHLSDLASCWKTGPNDPSRHSSPDLRTFALL